MSAPVYIPYCGSPPMPADWVGNWNLDPFLLSALGVVAASYALGATGAGLARGRRAAFYAGFGVLALALVSPLCNLTVALFSARVAQHMLIALVAAPLIVYGRPERACAWLWPAAWRAIGGADGRRRGVAFGATSALVFAVTLWLWHAPYFYDLTLQSHTAYWAMHLSLIAAALLLWRALLDTIADDGLAALGTALFSMVQMGVLGALLTFAPATWYISHHLTTWPWGLAALEDQQLGGLIMWVPGGGAFLLAALFISARLLTQLERRHAV